MEGGSITIIAIGRSSNSIRRMITSIDSIVITSSSNSIRNTISLILIRL
jgi:hypothetical protein